MTKDERMLVEVWHHLLALLTRCCAGHRPRQPYHVRWRVTWEPSGHTCRGENMALVAKVTEQVALVPEFFDDLNNPAPIEAILGWGVSDPAIAGIFPAADGLTAKLKPIVKGAVQASVRADARFGPEVKEIIGVLDVQFEAGEATIVRLTGTVEPLEP